MTAEEFLEQFADMLQLENAIASGTELAQMPEWDSLAWMMLLAFAERENLARVSLEQLKSAKTVNDLWKMLSKGR